MHFSLGSYSHKRVQPACRQLSAADGELDELFVQHPSLVHSISCARALQLTCTDLARLLAQSQWPCSSWVSTYLFWKDLLAPQPLSLPKGAGRVSPLLVLPVSSYTGGAWGCGHSILQNHRKERLISKSHFGHPKCCWLGSITPITYSFSVAVSLENLECICTGHFERLSTLKTVDSNVDSHLTRESSPRYGICVGHTTEGVKVSPLERASALGCPSLLADWLVFMSLPCTSS